MANSGFIKTLVDLIKGDDDEDRLDRRIAPWAELATSQNNPWMNAIRLHDSGRYEDAYFQYMQDAENSGKAHHFARAALSLALAAHCLESIGQASLANQITGLARWCYDQQASMSADSEEVILTRIKSGRLLDIGKDWKMEASVSKT
jgi:hypothetical protein